jgi:hypothetical protein
VKIDPKLEKALAAARAIMAEQGQSLDIDLSSVPTPIEYERQREDTKERNILAIEGVLRQQHYKHGLMLVTCKECNEKFQTNYCYVRYCSDTCRYESFRKHYGIEYGKVKTPTSYWEYETPIVVPPDLLRGLVGWARELVRQYEALPDTMQNQTPEEDQDYTPILEDYEPVGLSSKPEIESPTSSTEESSSSLPASPQYTLDNPVIEDFGFDDLLSQF